MKHSLILLSALTITPSTIFTGEDRGILFSLAVDCQPATCPENIELIQWTDETRQKSKSRWLLEDKGLWGDQQAGDSIYSRQVYFKKDLPNILFFTAKDQQGQLQIAARPNFLQLMKIVLEKFKKAL